MQDRRRQSATEVITVLNNLAKPARIREITAELNRLNMKNSDGNLHQILQALITNDYVTREKTRYQGDTRVIWIYLYKLTALGHKAAISKIFLNLITDRERAELKNRIQIAKTQQLPVENFIPAPMLAFFRLTKDRGPCTTQIKERVQIHNNYENEGLTY